MSGYSQAPIRVSSAGWETEVQLQSSLSLRCLQLPLDGHTTSLCIPLHFFRP